MALTAAQRKQNERDRKNGIPETYQSEPKPLKSDIEKKINQHVLDMRWAVEQDATDKFYKSECRPAVDLLAIYEGTNILNKEVEDCDEEEVGDGEGRKKKAKPKKKENVPNPSVQKLTIRAVVERIEMAPGVFVERNIEPNDLAGRKLKEVDEVVSFQKWLDLRDKGRKDLLWLGRMAGKNLYHKSHQIICDQFVKKNFDGLYYPGFDQDDLHLMIGKQQRFANDGVTPTRTALIMAPRSGYKSTIDGLDAVQWMLNCPDIRIMLITAFRRLAKTFLGEIKTYFRLGLHAEPTAFHLLYPEYCLRGVDGKSKEPIQCPAALLNSKEPHLWITSMESSATGMRCDIRKADDIVDPKNSDTDELRVAFKYAFDGTNDLVEPWGFTDVVGTRYFTKDWYGTRMETDENGQLPAPYKYLWIPAWTPKPEYETLYGTLLNTPNGMFQVKEDMVSLWFPEKLSFSFLMNTLKEKKERSFKNQQLNIATDPEEIDDYVNQFTLDDLRAHSYARTAAPQTGMTVVQLWDVAYGERKTSDWSVGATIGINLTPTKQEEVIVLDVVLGKWNQKELPLQMAAFYDRHQSLGINRVHVEDALGVKFLLENIGNFCKVRGLDFSTKIRLLPMSTSPNAKRTRIKNLAFLLGQNRLHFVTGAWNDEVFKQFVEYKGGKSTAYRKDDAPDCISLVTSLLSVTSLTGTPDPKKIEEEHEKRVAKAMREGLYNRMHGGPSPLRPKPTITATEPPPSDPRSEALKKMGRILPAGMRL